MKPLALAVMLALGTFALVPQAQAAGCVNGVYRAGCAGPNGAAVVRKPVAPGPATAAVVVAPHSSVSCVNGIYRAGCAGPNGAAVVRKPY